MTPMHEFAAQYAGKGLLVHPLKPRSKKPATTNGFLDATNDLDRVARWFRPGGVKNIGIACTPESGVFLVDVDSKNGGLESFAKLEAELGAFPATPRVETPGGGFHYYVVHPQDGRGNEAVGGSGIDTRGAGYGAAPPSEHPDGGFYKWVPGASLLDIPLAVLPEKWLAAIRGPVRNVSKRGARSHNKSQSGSLPEGLRNTALFKEACRLRSLGLDESEILPLVLQKNDLEAIPPLDEGEVRSAVASAMKYDPRENDDVSDVANARRLTAAMAGNFRFSAGGWWHYRDGCWRGDARSDLVQIAIAVGDRILSDRRLGL
jgi:hypothetical protein